MVDQSVPMPKIIPRKREQEKSGPPFINLTDVPPQPLILKNSLSDGGDYKDNTRRRPVKPRSSKYTGVYFDKTLGKWKAQIMVDGRVRSIGYYEREENAAGDYARAALKYKVCKSEGTYGGLDLRDVPTQTLIVSDSASGYKGVKKSKGRWQARIAVQKGAVPKTLGTFGSPEEAAAIYARAAFYLEHRRTRGDEVGESTEVTNTSGRCVEV